MVIFAYKENSLAPQFGLDTNKLGFVPSVGDVIKLRAVGSYVIDKRIISGDSEENLTISLVVQKIENVKQMLESHG